MSEFLSLLFSENMHTRTDIDVIKMADFSSAFSFQNTHTLLRGLFVSSQNVLIFILAFFSGKTHTRTDIDIIKMVDFFIRIFFSKHAHTHRYAFYKVAYLFHLKMFEFLFLLFSKKTHTRTDIDVIKMADFFIRIFFSKHAHTHRYEFYKVAYLFPLKMFEFLFLLFLKRRTHAQIYRCYENGRFSSAYYFSFQNTHTRTDMNVTKWLIFSSQNV